MLPLLLILTIEYYFLNLFLNSSRGAHTWNLQILLKDLKGIGRSALAVAVHITADLVTVSAACRTREGTQRILWRDLTVAIDIAATSIPCNEYLI